MAVVSTRTCSTCGDVLPLSDFLTNKDWDDNLGKDNVCKSCLKACDTRAKLREYFWNNNRKFSDTLWSAASAKAEQDAKGAAQYKRAPNDVKAAILEGLTCERAIALMNTSKYYSYEEHDSEFDPTEAEASTSSDEKSYSKEFKGMYAPRELETLHEYYNDLAAENDLSTRTAKDYAQKMAKASLLYDETFDAYRNGEATIEDLQRASSLLDAVSKTGALAPSNKAGKEEGDSGSWGELTLKLITTGHPCTKAIDWPQDVVDKLLAEYQHIAGAIGIDE